VKFVINTLDTLKENFVDIDQTIEPLEVRRIDSSVTRTKENSIGSL